MAAIFGVLLLGACDREAPVQSGEDELEEAPVLQIEEREEREDLGLEEAESAEKAGPESLWLRTWPGREEHSSVAVMWLGGNQEIGIHEEPDGESAEVGRFSFLDGDDLEWNQSRVLVDEPRELTVAAETEWVGIPFDPDYEELEARPRSFYLEEGEAIYLYQYEGEGTCFLGVQGEVVLGDCPGGEVRVEQELEEGEQWRPLSQQWWLLIAVEGREGWMRVDEAPVEVRRIDLSDQGYDSPYGADEF